MKLGLVIEPLEQPFRVALETAAKLHVSGIQIDACGDFAPDRLTETGQRNVVSIVKSHDLRLAALRCPLRHGIDQQLGQQKRIDYITKVMHLAASLQVKHVVIPLPRIPGEPEQQRSLTMRETLTDLGRYADRVGVTLALEPGLDPGQDVSAYIDTFRFGNFGLTFDPANFLLNRHDPILSLQQMAQKVVYCQARDARNSSPSGLGYEVAVGNGDIDWLALIAVLESIGYQGYCCVDREQGPNRGQDVLAGVTFLKRFIRTKA